MKSVFVFNRKKILIVFLILALVSMLVIKFDLILKYSIHTNSMRFLDTQTYFEPGIPPEGSVEEIYQDIFVSLLSPYIEEAVENYYGQPFSIAPYSVRVQSVERPNGYRTFEFLITLEVMPYYGPHNSVGVDRITIRVKSSKAMVERFDHIKSYDIPPKPIRP